MFFFLFSNLDTPGPGKSKSSIKHQSNKDRYWSKLASKMFVQAAAPCLQSMSPWRTGSFPFTSICVVIGGTLLAQII